MENEERVTAKSKLATGIKDSIESSRWEGVWLIAARMTLRWLELRKFRVRVALTTSRRLPHEIVGLHQNEKQFRMDTIYARE